MLNIIVGRAGSGKSHACFSCAYDIIKRDKLNARVTFLVPAFLSFHSEREFASLHGGAFNVHFDSFQRFAVRALRNLNIEPNVQSDFAVALIVTNILRLNRMHFFRYKSRGLARLLSNLVDELQRSNIDLDDFERIAVALKNHKFRDIVFIARLLKKISLPNNLDNIIPRVADIPDINRTHFFIDGFAFFDPIQLNLIEQLIVNAPSVTISLTIGNHRAFNRTKGALEELQRIAGKLNVPCHVRQLTDKPRFLSPALADLEQNFFRRKFRSKHSDGLRVIRAQNPYAEAAAVANQIVALVKDGYRPRDIAILIRDPQLMPVIFSALNSRNIPFDADSSYTAASTPVAHFISAALEGLSDVWSLDIIFECLRSGVFDFDGNLLDRAESFAAFNNFHTLSEWSSPWSCDDEIEQLRRFTFDLIFNFSEIFRRADSLHKKIDALLHVIENFDCDPRVIDILASIPSLLDDFDIDDTAFAHLIFDALNSLPMRRIPHSLNAVLVSDFDLNSAANSLVVFVVGFTALYFPKSRKAVSVLSTPDRIRLARAGLNFNLPSHNDELSIIYRSLCSARKLLILSFSLSDRREHPNRPSFLLRRFLSFFDINISNVDVDVLDSCGSDSVNVRQPLALSSAAARDTFLDNRNFRITVSQIDTFNRCPFRFFAECGLRLKQPPSLEVSAADIGSFLHDALFRFALLVKRSNRSWASFDQHELQVAFDSVFDDIGFPTHTRTLIQMRERTKRIAIQAVAHFCQFDAVSHFHPARFEVPFSFNRPCDDFSVELAGRFDRIDFTADRKFFIIFDYKLRRPEPRFASLQLPLYLLAASRLFPDSEPAALLFAPLNFAPLHARNAEQAESLIREQLNFSGVIRADLAELIDPSNSFLHVTKKNRLSQVDFSDLIQRAEASLLNTSNMILSGSVTPSPNNFCSFCSVSSLCNIFL